ncbi:hypothetical protein [Lysobacter gummosus]|uniref:hypothetical protein n=1 Tax=Lysobacter gummosus TaxID=262324 RepID=UPI00363408F9
MPGFAARGDRAALRLEEKPRTCVSRRAGLNACAGARRRNRRSPCPCFYRCPGRNQSRPGATGQCFGAT